MTLSGQLAILAFIFIFATPIKAALELDPQEIEAVILPLENSEGENGEVRKATFDGILIPISVGKETKSINKFREYLSRGILSCTIKYVTSLQKLNKLIADAHREYSDCQRQLERAEKTEEELEKAQKLAAQLEAISDLLYE